MPEDPVARYFFTGGGYFLNNFAIALLRFLVTLFRIFARTQSLAGFAAPDLVLSGYVIQVHIDSPGIDG